MKKMILALVCLFAFSCIVDAAPPRRVGLRGGRIGLRGGRGFFGLGRFGGLGYGVGGLNGLGYGAGFTAGYSMPISQQLITTSFVPVQNVQTFSAPAPTCSGAALTGAAYGAGFNADFENFGFRGGIGDRRGVRFEGGRFR
jgi:hypothetical protein